MYTDDSEKVMKTEQFSLLTKELAQKWVMVWLDVLWFDVEMSNKVLSKLEPQESSRMATTRPYYYTDHAGAKQGSAHPPHSMPTRRTSTGIFIPHQKKAFVPLTILIKKAVKLKKKRILQLQAVDLF